MSYESELTKRIERVAQLAKEERKRLYEELLGKDPERKFVRRVTPRTSQLKLKFIKTKSITNLRNELKEFVGKTWFNKVYTDRYINDSGTVRAYTVVETRSPWMLIKTAKKLEKKYPVKVFLMPYVEESHRPLSYFKLKVFMKLAV